MAAGQGFKTFVTGEVLTAGDTNGYLMQGINVFASTAARDAAITSPQEGQFAFTKDTNGLWYYDGAAWVASGATGDIEGVTAGIGISGGGTSGTVTVTNSMATAIDAKGDLVAGTGADAFSRLAVGANDTVLTADSAQATGLKWATVASGRTLLSTTTLTGASTTVSGISGAYKDLLVIVYRMTNSTADGTLNITPNGSSSSMTSGVTGDATTGTTFARNSTATAIGSIIAISSTNINNVFYLTLQDYAQSTYLNGIQLNGRYINTSGNGASVNLAGGFFAAGVPITSITFANTGGNFSAGTVEIYGVN